MGREPSLPAVEHQGYRSVVGMNVEYWLMVVTVRFYCGVISCTQGMRRGVAEAIASGGIQHVWAW